MRNHVNHLLNRSATMVTAAFIITSIQLTTQPAHGANGHWPDTIPIPVGFESEGIEMGKGSEFFLGAFSFSSFFGPAFGVSHKLSSFAGAIYKGDLRTGKGEMLVPPTGKPVGGLSYDPRTDYLTGSYRDQGVVVYNASNGDLIAEIIFGDNIAINDVLVTRSGVYCTDSLNADLYKIVLEKDGRLSPSTGSCRIGKGWRNHFRPGAASPVRQPQRSRSRNGDKTLSPSFEVIEMHGFEMVDAYDEFGAFVDKGLNANGLVAGFDGKKLLVINGNTGVLYLVDTESGVAHPVAIQGDEQLFANADGLYLEGRTLYLLQNFANKIAVVQLSGDLTEGEFVKNIPGPDDVNPLNVATTLIGFGNSLYAINTHVFDLLFGNPALVQSEVVRLRK